MLSYIKLNMGIASKDGEIEHSLIWECLDCGCQWADTQISLCLDCNSNLVELLCDTKDQFYLLRHEDATV